MEPAATVPRRLLSERIFSAAPLPPAALGAAIAAFLVLFLFVSAWATGDLAQMADEGQRWWQNRDARLAVVVSLLAAAILTALRYHAAGTREDLAAVARVGGWRISEIDPTARPGDARRQWTAGLAGAAFVPLVALLVDRDPGLYFQPGYWYFSKAWTWILGCAVSCGGGLLSYRATRDARHFSRLAERLPDVDLLDPSGLAPFARQGLRATVPGLLVLTFFALNAPDQGFFWALGVLGTLSLASGAFTLGIPLRGVRDRMRRAKREELARTHAAIRGEPGALSGSPLAARAQAPSLSDLLAWRAQILAVPEWPVDPTTLGRYGLYLAIPLASWVGGALVERVLDALLS